MSCFPLPGTERQSSSLQLFWSVRNRDAWLPPVEFLWSGTAGCSPLSSPLSTRLVRRMTFIWLRLLRPSQYLKVRPLCRSQSNFKRENMMSISYDCFSLGYFEDVFLVLKDISCLSSKKEFFKMIIRKYKALTFLFIIHLMKVKTKIMRSKNYQDS